MRRASRRHRPSHRMTARRPDHGAVKNPVPSWPPALPALNAVRCCRRKIALGRTRGCLAVGYRDFRSIESGGVCGALDPYQTGADCPTGLAGLDCGG